jgi:hypothetical protein
MVVTIKCFHNHVIFGKRPTQDTVGDILKETFTFNEFTMFKL